jgi:hypothetical protein
MKRLKGNVPKFGLSFGTSPNISHRSDFRRTPEHPYNNVLFEFLDSEISPGNRVLIWVCGSVEVQLDGCFQRGLIKGSVTAKVLSRKRRKEERQDRKKPAVPRTNLIWLG